MNRPDRPGAALLELVAVMDRLRSPGGCPWDAEQTHSSLLKYLVEETYETIEAVESGDRAHLREELGDLLLQVVFHARIAAEDAADPFDIDDVAAGIAAKLVRRHPHVFADEVAETAADVEANWEKLKAAEKGRTSAMDGVPLAQPALALADKLLSRAEKAPLVVPVPQADVPADADLGELLFATVAAARARGLDAEAELRAACRRFAATVRDLESAAAREPGEGGGA
ncbi:MazG family protein [Sporichthya polymorpha]|uniref:MazG family protein n=1 Tax=Sporichthya polymorpha TaxID=35751 RepID=UPI00037F2436|nr:MazG family protein [Sporichthya polymorpha]